jgi:hypothetical protein
VVVASREETVGGAPLDRVGVLRVDVAVLVGHVVDPLLDVSALRVADHRLQPAREIRLPAHRKNGCFLSLRGPGVRMVRA